MEWLWVAELNSLQGKLSTQPAVDKEMWVTRSGEKFDENKKEQTSQINCKWFLSWCSSYVYGMYDRQFRCSIDDDDDCCRVNNTDYAMY